MGSRHLFFRRSLAFLFITILNGVCLSAEVPKQKANPAGKASGNPSAAGQKTSPPQKGTSVQQSPKSKPSTSSGSKTASSKTSKKSKSASRSKSRKVRGQREIEPARVSEIQHALAGVGFYSGQPTGNWDQQTTQAMRAYQEAHGFKITGKPDALSLKKLGL